VSDEAVDSSAADPAAAAAATAALLLLHTLNTPSFMLSVRVRLLFHF